METPTIHNTKIAQLAINGNPIERGTFPAMKQLEKTYKQNGYCRTHVGYAPFFSGVHYCKKCESMAKNPYVKIHQGCKYYNCGQCGTINYVQQ